MSDAGRAIHITISPKGEITIQTKNLLDPPHMPGEGMTVHVMPNGSLLIVVRDGSKGGP